jgi:hypothetical protein
VLEVKERREHIVKAIVISETELSFSVVFMLPVPPPFTNLSSIPSFCIEHIVKAIQKLGIELRFVNGGGTGSIKTTEKDNSVSVIKQLRRIKSRTYCNL